MRRSGAVPAINSGIVAKLSLAVFALPLTCFTLCTFRVQPLSGWMMRQHCPFSWLAMHPPARPLPGMQSSSR